MDQTYGEYKELQRLKGIALSVALKLLERQNVVEPAIYLALLGEPEAYGHMYKICISFNVGNKCFLVLITLDFKGGFWELKTSENRTEDMAQAGHPELTTYSGYVGVDRLSDGQYVTRVSP